MDSGNLKEPRFEGTAKKSFVPLLLFQPLLKCRNV